MTLKRILSLCLALAMLLTLAPNLPIAARAESYSGTCGENLTWELTEDGTLTISGTGDMYDYGETSNKAPWRDYWEQFTKVVIEDGVTGIGDYAFYDCDNMYCITVPASVTYFGNYAVYFTSSRMIVLFRGTEEQWSAIEMGRGNYGIDNITPCYNYVDGENAIIATEEDSWVDVNVTWTLDLEGTLTISGEGQMYDLYIEYEGDYPWKDYGWTASWQNVFIQKVIIEDGITSIGNYAFQGCVALTSARIPSSVTRISVGAFGGCDNLQGNVYEDALYLGNTEDPYVALLRGGSSSVVHEDTQVIVDHAYADATATSVVIPAGVGYIGDFAFNGCGSLASIQVDPNNPNYSSDDSGVFFNKEKTVLLCAPGAISGAYTIPEGVTYISENAFRDCENLQTVIMADSVEQIADGAFYGCTSLAELSFGDGLRRLGDDVFVNCTSLLYTEQDGMCFLGDRENPYVVLVEVTDESCLSYSIPEGTKFIGDYAFYFCKQITTVTIPSTICQIDCHAFACSSLWHILYRGTEEQGKEIAFCDYYHGGGYTCGDHHFEAFFYGWAGDGCGNYEEDCFFGDTVIHFNATGEEVTDPEGKYCTICNGPVESDVIASGTCGENLTWELDKDGVLTISGTGDMYDYGETSNIAPWRDYGEQFTKVVIEDGVTSIGDCAFYDGYYLTSVTIGNGVTSIDYAAFAFCIAMGEITIPDSVTNIGDYAFYFCMSLASITIPDGITSIGQCAFAGCTYMTEIAFEGDAPVIGDSAFYSVYATVYYPLDNETWTSNVMQDYGGTITWVAYEKQAASGDANGDGVVNTTDAKLIMQYELGLIDGQGLDLDAVDVNGDGVVNTTDAKLIMQYELGLITEFPKP